MADETGNQYKRLRKFLNPIIKGKFTESILNAFAIGDQANADNVVLLKQNLFVATATGKFLDNLLASWGLTRPIGIGMSDDAYRELGIGETNVKLVEDAYLNTLEAFYGSDSVRPYILSGKQEFYNLEEGDTLFISADNRDPIVVTFKAKDFADIHKATAIEVAAIITKAAISYNYPVTGSVYEDQASNQTYVKVQSTTRGTLANITIRGGEAQPKLQFAIVSMAQSQNGTQYTTSFESDKVRFTWTGGPNPNLQYINVGDYVTMYGASINPGNQGTFTIQTINAGNVGEAYFEIINPYYQDQGDIICNPVDEISANGVIYKDAAQQFIITTAIRNNGITTITTDGPNNINIGDTVTLLSVDNSSFDGNYVVTGKAGNTLVYSQQYSNDIAFFGPKTVALTNLDRYATVYQVNPNEVTIIMPVITNVVRRTLKGSWHVHTGPLDDSYLGNYIYGPNSDKLSIRSVYTQIKEEINVNDIKYNLNVQNSKDFPNEGYLMFGFGTDDQEGPVRFYSKPSNSSLLLDATYRFKKNHSLNSGVYLLQDTIPYTPKTDGSDYPTYVTDSGAGRIAAEAAIERIKAGGIFVNILLVLPKGPGHHSQRYVYGLDDTDTVYGEE